MSLCKSRGNILVVVRKCIERLLKNYSSECLTKIANLWYYFFKISLVALLHTILST